MRSNNIGLFKYISLQPEKKKLSTFNIPSTFYQHGERKKKKEEEEEETINLRIR
jgi:hypothetical protein